VAGAVAGTNTQMGSSPTDRLRIVPTKDEELSQIYMPLFVGIVGSNLSDPTKIEQIVVKHFAKNRQ
jgi:hypothetical protein